MLVTLVENIFKHGSCTNEQPANILCTIDPETNRLSFTTENFIGSQYNEKSGLGLENLKKRLSIIYADNYTFNYSVTANVFKAALDIPFTNK